MIVGGVDLFPGPCGHLAARRQPSHDNPAVIVGYCAACGSEFDLALQIDLSRLCTGHQTWSAGMFYCSTVEEHLERVEREMAPIRWYGPGGGSMGGAATA